MGVPTEDEPYGNDCVACFPIGKTPLLVRMAVTGVKIGDLWTPFHGTPANGIWELTQFIPCGWVLIKGPYLIIMTCDNPGSQFNISGPGLVNHFIGGNPASCKWWFANTLPGPANTHFYGGIAQMSWMSTSPGPSATRIMDDLNIERGDDALCDPYPTADESLLVSYVRKKDNSHIWIKHKE